MPDKCRSSPLLSLLGILGHAEIIASTKTKIMILMAFMSFSVAGKAQRVVLPVKMVDLPNGDRRFVTMLTIDHRPVEAGIDTGSTGLRVLPRGLKERAFRQGPKVTYSYGGGTAFDGREETVTVGAGVISGAVNLMRITGVGCTMKHPDCPVANMDLAGYGIQGDGIAGQGFPAILGIRLQHDKIENPLEQLGVRRWIIDLPRTSAEIGRIILNPDDAEVADYARLAIDVDGMTPGCLEGPERICGRMFFDSGAAGLRVIRERPFHPWPTDTNVTISVGSGTNIQSFTVKIGRRDQASKLQYAAGEAETRLSLGFAPYFKWLVLYDPENLQIGVKGR